MAVALDQELQYACGGTFLYDNTQQQADTTKRQRFYLLKARSEALS